MGQKPTLGGGSPTTDPTEDLNPFHIAAQQFDRAAAHLPGLKRGLIDFLKRPARTVIVEFPVEMADGSVRIFTGYRVLHSHVRGPGKGGILVNAGGVCVSYFEWVQNIENEQWDLDEVNQKLRARMERATDAVLDRQKEMSGEGSPQPIDLRTAALVLRQGPGRTGQNDAGPVAGPGAGGRHDPASERPAGRLCLDLGGTILDPDGQSPAPPRPCECG
jgi:hypothetical protein